MPRILAVIESETTRGSGKSEDDRVRVVRQYHTLDGELLAESDPGDGMERLTLREVFQFFNRRGQLSIAVDVLASAGFTWPTVWTAHVRDTPQSANAVAGDSQISTDAEAREIL